MESKIMAILTVRELKIGGRQVILGMDLLLPRTRSNIREGCCPGRVCRICVLVIAISTKLRNKVN